MLATFGIVLAFPLAVLVALGRRSDLPAIRSLCIVYVELIRGVPLISVLFMASFMFPLFLPAGKSPDVLLRVLVGITLFSAAYLAEMVRGGLQAIPRGQVEAAADARPHLLADAAQDRAAAGAGHRGAGDHEQLHRDLQGHLAGDDRGLYELTGALALALNSDANWRPFKLEGYLFIAADLLRLLLRHVALQPVGREAGQRAARRARRRNRPGPLA